MLLTECFATDQIKGMLQGGGEALAGKPEGMKHLEDQGIDGSIILRYVWKCDGKAWTGFIWFMTYRSGRLL